MKTFEAAGQYTSGSIAIVTTRWNSFITNNLLDGAKKALSQHAVSDDQIDVFRVPGAFELPMAAQRVLQTGNYDALIALGCVIRGETPHFEYVSGGCMDGLMQVQLKMDVPVGFGVLTVDSTEQAIDRSAADANNKGAEAALTILEMMNLLREIQM